MVNFDAVVIGGGPGGYVCAIRLAQLGKSVALVDKRKTLGGTCLNVGCIPSKALLDSTEFYHQAKTKFGVHGIEMSGIAVNWEQMQKRKRDVVGATTKGIDYLMSKNNISRLHGEAKILNPSLVLVGDQEISTRSIVIATGSIPVEIPFLPFDGRYILSSDDALALSAIPSSLIVVGGGVIGVEMGSIYARLGTKVTVVEAMPNLIPTMDTDLAKALEKSLKPLGMAFQFNTKVTGMAIHNNQVLLQGMAKSGPVELTADACLVCVGRRPYFDGLGVPELGIQLDARGRIQVNHRFETNVAGIYAIGDVIPGPMLAHKASEEGSACADWIAGRHGHINYHAIPSVVYTWPEVASVGFSESELTAADRSFKKGVVPFKASGRARAAEETEGFIKVLADSKTDEVLGIHMIGPRCADLIAEAVCAVEYKASAEDIGLMSHPHPTFSETLKEAALMATDNRAIHV